MSKIKNQRDLDKVQIEMEYQSARASLKQQVCSQYAGVRTNKMWSKNRWTHANPCPPPHALTMDMRGLNLTEHLWLHLANYMT